MIMMKRRPNATGVAASQSGLWLIVASALLWSAPARANNLEDANAAFKPGGRTIGLAITDVRYALVESPMAKECSLGLQKDELAQYKAEPGYRERLQRIGGTYDTRGPNGEATGYIPMSAVDPLPFSEVITPKGFGLNLDGTSNGHATAKTRQHGKFISPENEKVDNELARVIGCVHGYRTSGYLEGWYLTILWSETVSRQLIEITGVDDVKNDPSVDVTFYKGIDRLVRMGGGDEFIPYQSHRIDTELPRYILRTHGKIVDGILTTAPIPEARMPRTLEGKAADWVMKDMGVRLRLTENGAEGIIGGYQDTALWWEVHSKVIGPGGYSNPNLYRALLRYADAYPDPQTGRYSHISMALKIKATRAIIVKPKAGGAGTAQNAVVATASAKGGNR